MFIAKISQLLFAIWPINAIAFALGEVAGIANFTVVKVDCGFLSGYGVLEFDRRIWALIRYHALFAIDNCCRQAIVSVRPRVACCVECQIDGLRIFNLFQV